MDDGLLVVQELSVTFRRIEPWGHAVYIPVLRRVSLDIACGEIVAVVGGSGAGKTILAHAILGILPGNAAITGRILHRGDVLTRSRLAKLRGHDIALVPQSISFLDPLVRVKHAVRWAAHLAGLDSMDAIAAQAKALTAAGLSEEVGDRFPCQLSGGMARRVLLAMAIVSNPSLLIADEPTPGLHPEAVRESLAQLRRFADEGKAVLLISHDIAACLAVADRVAIFQDGAIVEVAPAGAFSKHDLGLRHPYSQALWNALPQNAFVPEAKARPADSGKLHVVDGHMAARSPDETREGRHAERA